MLKGYSRRTIKTYFGHVRRYVQYAEEHVTPVGNAICIQQYLLFLLKNHYLHAYVNQAVSALKFYTIHVLGEPLAGDAYVRPKKEGKLPNVLSLEKCGWCWDTYTT